MFAWKSTKPCFPLVIYFEYTCYGKSALYVSCDITTEIGWKVQEDDATTSEQKMVPQEQILFIQKDDFVQKGNVQKQASHEVVHHQSFLCTLHRHIQKVKKVIWQDTEEALTSLNGWQTNKRLLFHFCVSVEKWEKGRLFLLYPIIDQKEHKNQGLQTSTVIFWSLYKARCWRKSG